MSGTLDARRNAIRPDLADAALKGKVEAERFVTGDVRRIREPCVALRRHPAPDAPVDTEFLYGERVTVFDRDGGWCWVQSDVDRYVGYVEHTALEPEVALEPGLALHRISVPLALVFPEPSIKVSPVLRLPMGAVIAAGDMERHGNEHFHKTPGGYVLTQHCTLATRAAKDWVAVAETFVGTPYLWGGKSWLGIDCSGLVQLALQMAGRTAPRDSDMQARELGEGLPHDPLPDLERGDLVFWRGHVGIMLDPSRLLHANGYHHRTAIEPLAETIARLNALGLLPTAYRRIP
ncbi:NlpC/P60 family protein [Acuticoccus sp. I52.16.1]|uniref:C40 family peptidase n=1 Tax=Acuticoccus sp. I52.16.1 TaxID=2928472 RepID=UPI001FD4E3E4|nr:NlpC/P60 family protein [Acuticoccus sp. I52.16.1]UOM34934.1 C40 family peptidase [Acuticoccus sp. I52.16.1]